MPMNSSKIPTVRLCIPQLLQPLALWKKDFLFEVEAPDLGQLLRQFDVIQNKSIQGLEACLFDALGLVDNLELPAAYYRYQTHQKIDQQKLRVCADPVHLEVGMNDITLTEKITDLSELEAEEIIEELNKHFKQDGLVFEQGSAQQWYIVLPEEEAIQTTPLSQVLRKNIASYQTKSKSRNWQVIQNESQMILHSCAVNQQREMAGLTTVNSLWFWGGGKAFKAQHDIQNIYCNKMAKSDVEMIAKAANCEILVLEKELPAFESGKTLLVLDQLFSPAIHDNLDLYQQELERLDQQILRPLKQAWQAGRIELLIDGCDGKILKPIKPKVWNFWGKKPVLLSNVALLKMDKK
jgi:hypothetical protein